MNTSVANLVDISKSPIALCSAAESMLERANWAGQSYSQFNSSQVDKITKAVADAAYERAEHYAQWAVKETGFGVTKDKTLKNQLASRGLLDHYKDQNFVSARFNDRDKIIELPKPAGVIFALIPSTNPVATVYFKVLLALMTRNAVVMSPHPAARECSGDAIAYLAKVAEEAGAPSGIIQVISKPNIPLVDAFMRSEKTAVILATGGNPMVRAAYSSSNPALGVGPGNAPVFVDKSADLNAAAQHIIASKSFDNSVLCTSESVLITLNECQAELSTALEKAGAFLCNQEETDAVRRYLFHQRGFNIEAIGRDATWIAEQAGVKVPPSSKILITPIQRIGPEEKLSKEKLCPVLGMFIASSRQQAISLARQQLRMSGAGHSAALHARDEKVIMAYAQAVEVYRVILNAPCSQGAAGFATNLAPSFTIGTGYFGRSSVGENVGPKHLVHWTRVAYAKESSEIFGNFDNFNTDYNAADLTDEKPVTNIHYSEQNPPSSTPPQTQDSVNESDIRRMIVEEIRNALKR